MENLNNYNERDYAINVRLSHLALQMVELFTDGHDVQQTPEYEQIRQQYMQLQVDRMYPDEPMGSRPFWNIG